MSETILEGGLTDPITTKYKVGSQIGQPGQFGSAHLVTSLKDGTKLAAKRILKTKFARGDIEFHFGQLRDEIKIMTELKHENIIQIYEVFEEKNSLWIVMELCAGGELFDRIKDQPSGNYTEKGAAGVLKQMLEGIKYLHQNRIAHCDLKPDNFLFSSNDTNSCLKIIDFGMSKHVEKPWKYLTSFRGTPYYVAPEVLQKKYLIQCDMWSFGVVMFVMLFGYPPFHDENDDKLFKKIRKGFDPHVKKGFGAFFPAAIPVSEDARDLISRCLLMDTYNRLTAEEALQHKWFHGGAAETPLVDMLKNLDDFTHKIAFRSKVLGTMAEDMSKDDLKALKDSFNKLDKDGNGLISKDELAAGLEGHSQKAIETLIKMADMDGDGNLSWHELLLAATQRKLRATEERLFKAFQQFDKDGDGTITKTEIAQVLQIDETEAAGLVAEIDKNGDGMIDYQEFYDMMMAKESADLKELQVS